MRWNRRRKSLIRRTVCLFSLSFVSLRVRVLPIRDKFQLDFERSSSCCPWLVPPDAAMFAGIVYFQQTSKQCFRRSLSISRCIRGSSQSPQSMTLTHLSISTIFTRNFSTNDRHSNNSTPQLSIPPTPIVIFLHPFATTPQSPSSPPKKQKQKEGEILNYFNLLELPETFMLDPLELTKAFQNKMRQYHPDKFARAEEKEKKQAEEISRQLNRAKSVLDTPLWRAQHLLSLKGIDSAHYGELLRVCALLSTLPRPVV